MIWLSPSWFVKMSGVDRSSFALMLLLLAAVVAPTVGASFTPLYTFTQYGFNGVYPSGSLTPSGNFLYGTATQGGSGGYGTIFSVNENGIGFEVLHNFTGGADGSEPYGTLVLSGNILYGMTYEGGSHGAGDIFSININGSDFAVLHSFAYSSDGGYPQSSLALSGNVLYGTTYEGGATGWGTIFSVDTNGMGFNVIYTFTDGNDGGRPIGAIAVAGNVIYGTATQGGSDGDGTVFSIGTNGIGFNTIYSLTGGSGDAPYDIALYGNTLYGVAYQGGGMGYGTIFTVNTNGAGSNTLYSFAGSNGENPETISVQGNVLYGTTYRGGSSGYGIVFTVNTNGAGFINLHSFNGGSDGAFPEGAITISGNLIYGTTSRDSGGAGALFSMETNGMSFNAFYSFTLNSESGTDPLGSLILSGNKLYGTASEGGFDSDGTLFSMNTDGTDYDVLHTFTGDDDGSTPLGSLILSGNMLYGTAAYGAINNDGTVFSINTDGEGFNVIYSFTGGSDGANPFGSLLLSGDTLYGTASEGGNDYVGTVFSVNTDGSAFSTLYTFTEGDDGETPVGSLILSGNVLYGTAEYGGDYDDGTLFSIGTDGTGFNAIYSFTGGDDGESPAGSLTLSGNMLYGTASTGGSYYDGTLFSINTDGGDFNAIYAFTGGNDGAEPVGSLTLSGNTLYGTAEQGGSDSEGTLFSINTYGSDFTTLYSFTGGDDGANPEGSLMLYNNTLYGTASEGGTAGQGTVFAYVPFVVATPNPYALSNGTISIGQVSVANTVMSYGVGPYTGNWFWAMANVSSGNTLTAGLPASNNALTLEIDALSPYEAVLTFNGVEYNVSAGGSGTIYGTWTFNAFAGDSSGEMGPNPPLTNTLFVSPTSTTTTTIPCVNGCYQGSGGTGSGQSQSTTSVITTTVTTIMNVTTLPTTTVTPVNVTTTIVPLVTVNVTMQHANVTANLSGNQPYEIRYAPSDASFVISSPYSTSVHFTISNQTSTSPAAPRNYTKLLALNVTIESSANASVYATINYPCGASAGGVAPFILDNGTWKRLAQFTVKPATCTISFAIPNDPVIALMQSNQTNSSTTAPSTTLSTMTQRETNVNSTPAYVPIIIVVVAVVVIYLFIRYRKMH